MHDGLAVADYSRKDFEELAREVLQTKRDSVIELRNEEAIRHCAGTNVTLIWPKPGFSGQRKNRHDAVKRDVERLRRSENLERSTPNVQCCMD